MFSAYVAFISVISGQVCICKWSDHIRRYRIMLLFLLRVNKIKKKEFFHHSFFVHPQNKI